VKNAILICVALISAVALALVALEVRHHWKYGDFSPFGMHADVTDFRADVGARNVIIFDAHLTNFGFYLQKIERCEALADVNAP
jgi:hypothetical protein